MLIVEGLHKFLDNIYLITDDYRLNKKMKNVEIQKLSLEELKTSLVSETDALARLKFAHAISPIENPLRIREARKVVARLQTAISAVK